SGSVGSGVGGAVAGAGAALVGGATAGGSVGAVPPAGGGGGVGSVGASGVAVGDVVGAAVAVGATPVVASFDDEPAHAASASDSSAAAAIVPLWARQCRTGIRGSPVVSRTFTDRFSTAEAGAPHRPTVTSRRRQVQHG